MVLSIDGVLMTTVHTSLTDITLDTTSWPTGIYLIVMTELGSGMVNTWNVYKS